jgi:hypothetical protein
VLCSQSSYAHPLIKNGEQRHNVYFLETLWRITDAGTIRHHSIAIAWLNLHNKHQPSMGLKD